MAAEQSPTALVLLNMGGPDSLEAVEPFLYQLFSDRELIQLPLGGLLQKPFARVLSHFRARHVRENYRMIGGRSPLLDWTERQARGIAELLDGDFRPFVAMRYWTPTADEVVRRIHADGIGRAVVLSMYPHFTKATTGSSLNDFQRAASAVPDLKYSAIEQWYGWPGYLDALAECVREGLTQIPEDVRERARVVFSAHALPQKFIDRGDPYLEHVMDTAKGVMARLEDRPWNLAFQSRSGPVKWMEPGTLEVIDQLAAQRQPAILLVPVSFVSDHIETLHEIDVEFRAHAEARGIKHFVRAPSLNDRPTFLRAMADLVKKQLEETS